MGTGWAMDDVRVSVSQATEILSQCKIFIPQAGLHVLDGPDVLKHFSDFIAIEIIRLVPFSKPTVYFVKETLQRDRYYAEAIGKSNSTTRPILKYISALHDI